MAQLIERSGRPFRRVSVIAGRAGRGILTALVLASGLTASFSARAAYYDQAPTDYYFEEPGMSFGRGGRGSQPVISLELDPQQNLNSAFRIAAREMRTRDLARLLKDGAQINSRSGSGNTALLYASVNCSESIADFLLRHGADPNLPDPEGRSPLMLASMGGCFPVVRLLLKAPGVDVLAHDRMGRTALDFAGDASALEVDGPAIEVIKLLKAAKWQAIAKGGHKAPNGQSVAKALVAESR